MNWYLTVLKKYAEFSGRARRKEYWMFNLINILIYTVPYIFLISAIIADPDAMDSGVIITLFSVIGVYGLVIFIPSLAVTVRRLHDTNRSGWNILWGLVPAIGGLIILYFLVSNGTPGNNNYGSDPKEGDDYQLYE